MNATKIAGVTAIVSGVALLVVIVASAAAGPVSTFGVGPNAPPAYGFPLGMGPGHMGNAPWTDAGTMGPGMMGPGMMGPGHRGGYGQGGATVDRSIPAAPQVTVTATDLSFSPSEVKLPANAPVNLTLANRGALLHDLTIPELGVRIVARPGETTTFGLRGLPAGRYGAYCSVPGHADAGMRMVVVVE